MKSLKSFIDQITFLLAKTDTSGHVVTSDSLFGAYDPDTPPLFWDLPCWSHSNSARAKIKVAVEHVLKRQTSSPVKDISIVSPTGTLIPLEMHVSPCYNEAGVFIGTLPHAAPLQKSANDPLETLFEDVLMSVQRDAKRELLLQSVMEIVPIPLVLVNSQGVSVMNNQAARNMSKEDAPPETTLEEWQGEFYRLDGTKYTNEDTPLGRALTAQEEVTDEAMIVRFINRKTPITILVTARPITHEGESLGAVCYWTQIETPPTETPQEAS